jgi:hypothetical protein
MKEIEYRPIKTKREAQLAAMLNQLPHQKASEKPYDTYGMRIYKEIAEQRLERKGIVTERSKQRLRRLWKKKLS